jgi:formate dehydrogenase
MRRRDLLIEHLHTRSRTATVICRMRTWSHWRQEMNLAMTEVYEVASFYHHFDIVKDGAAAPAAITVRVCDSLSCEMAGAQQLLQKLPRILGKDVRVIPAPCVGRCESAPVVVVGQNPLAHASAEGVAKLVAAKALRHHPGKYINYKEYRNSGGYTMLQECLSGKRDYQQLTKVMEDSGLRSVARLSAGRKWKSSAPSSNRA